MPEFYQSEAPRPAPIRAYGCRRVTLDMRAEIDKADSFAGLPRSTAKPFEILATFEQALPYLPLPALTQRLVGFLLRQTKPRIGRKAAGRLHGLPIPVCRNCSASPSGASRC